MDHARQTTLTNPSFRTQLYDEQPFSLLTFAVALLLMYAVARIQSDAVAAAATEDEATTARFRAGFFAATVLVCMYGLLMFRDGVMVNPHPALWRLLHAVSLCYLILLCIVFSLDLATARSFLGHLLPEPIQRVFDTDASANGMEHLLNCEFTADTLYRQLTSRWFLSHILGWVGYTLLIRDLMVCLAVSFLFEALELSLIAFIPEFQECWWDSLILDFSLCNMLGMLLGWQVLRFLNSRSWEWNDDWDTPAPEAEPASSSRLRKVAKNLGRRAKAVRSSMGPFVWTKYEWQIEATIQRYLSVCFLVFGILAASASIFFLNQLLGVPQNNNIHPVRLVVLVFGCFLPAASEHYMFTTSTSKNKRIGPAVWMALATISMEWAIIVKFAASVPKFHVVPDAAVLVPWALFFAAQLLWMCLLLVTKHWPGWYRQKLQPLVGVEQGTFLRLGLCATFVPLLSLTRNWAF